METISEQLDNEEAGLTIDRGLEGCIPGLQAFELFITTTFRKKYDKVKRAVRRHALEYALLECRTTVGLFVNPYLIDSKYP